VNRSLLFLLLWCALSSFAFAESDFERDLKQLIDQRDKARAAAIAPVDAKFKVAAEQLLRRATQLGDLDSANRIKAAIEGPGTLEAKTTGDFRKQIVGTQWKADAKLGLRPGLKDAISFTEKTMEPNGLDYEVGAKNSITIIFPKGDRQPMTLSKDGKRLEFVFKDKPHAYDLISP